MMDRMLLSSVLRDGAPGILANRGHAESRLLDSEKVEARDVDDLIARWSDRRPELRDRLVEAWEKGSPTDLASVAHLAPVRRPGKIVLVGATYASHCEEIGVPIPDRPLMLAKFPSAICGPFDDIVWSRSITDEVDYEAEVAVVIGSTTRDASPAEAQRSIWGYLGVNDVSARDVQRRDRQWVRGKSLDTFCPLGPQVLVPFTTTDEPTFQLKTTVNGEERQSDSTDHMLFSFAEIVSYLSRSFTLDPGDLVLTGTPAGTAIGRSAGFLKDGDLVEVEISGVGSLRNRCRELA